jgi:GT2 family glycosyltransferase
MNVSASIVLYNNSIIEIQELLVSLENVRVLFIIDNSPNDDLSVIQEKPNVTYIHNPSNPGFGSAHNIAIQKAIELGFNYHFIINPDIQIKDDVIAVMVEYVSNNSDVGMIMPQILNLDGTIQNLPKLLPSPYSIFMRKFKRPKFIYNNFINKYELRSVQKKIIYNAPILSGCFTLLNLEAIKKVGGYDDKFFMYFEDWDLSRRIHQHYKTIYFPLVSVYHGYESGANKSHKLFKIFINSAITYFNKWGWFFDTDRKNINKKALSQFT